MIEGEWYNTQDISENSENSESQKFGLSENQNRQKVILWVSDILKI